MELFSLLTESFRKVTINPKLFLPKIFSTVFASTLLLVFLDSPQKVVTASGSPFNAVLLTLGLVFLMGAIALFASLMVADMAYREEYLFFKSLKKVAGNTRSVLVFTSVTTLLALSMPLVVVLLWQFHSVQAAALGFLASLVVIFLFGYYGYFLPVTLLDSGVGAAFRKSLKLSRKSRKEVLPLTLFSFVMVGAAFVLEGRLRYLGYAGFVTARLVSTVVNTYVFVVSPELYRSVSESLD